MEKWRKGRRNGRIEEGKGMGKEREGEREGVKGFKTQSLHKMVKCGKMLGCNPAYF